MVGPVTALCDAVIFTGETMVEGHALLLRDGKILDIVRRAKLPPGAKIISYAERILAPGLIDAQINGGGNILFNNMPTAESCLAIARAHRKYGTTRLLPTIISDRPEIARQAIAAMRIARAKDPGILGIHIEGPHLSHERRGAHKDRYIRSMKDSDLALYKREGDEIMLMTVAPENVPPEQVGKLRQQGVIVSLGHTNATASQLRTALAAGATGFTHLYNAMGKPGSGAPTPADFAIEDQKSWCGLIVDGHHVQPELIRLALLSKPKGKVFLVSDAMPPSAADDPQPFMLYGEEIRAEGGRCVNGEGKLAGACLTLIEAVRNCIKLAGIELEEALRMASTYPAAFLGLDKRFGKLLPGYEGDVVVLDADLGCGDARLGNTA